MDNQIEVPPLQPIVSGQSITQEQAVLRLLSNLQRDLRAAEDAVFKLVHREARDHNSSNLALDVGEVRCALMAANRVMKNIDDLGVCFPGDAIKREAWRWVPMIGGE